VALICAAVGLAAMRESGRPVPASELVAAQAQLAALEQRIADLEQQLARLRARRATAPAVDHPLLDPAQLAPEEVAAICVAAAQRIEERYGDTAAALQRYRYAAKYFPGARASEVARSRITALEATEL
jgi:hypothetical protein